MVAGGRREEDQDFDAVAEDFEGEVYGSSKGRVRLGVLREDLFSKIPGLEDGGLSALDAGGGAGRVALLLAGVGNRAVLADPSHEMLTKAERAVAGSPPPPTVPSRPCARLSRLSGKSSVAKGSTWSAATPCSSGWRTRGRRSSTWPVSSRQEGASR